MSGTPQTHEEWCENMRKRPDSELLTIKELRNGGLKQVAAELVWQERQDAEEKKIRDEEFQRTSEWRQKREFRHDLVTYWKLADWQERIGMAGVYLFLILLGVGLGQIPEIANLVAFWRSVKP